jgi:hypothetical protein
MKNMKASVLMGYQRVVMNWLKIVQKGSELVNSRMGS